MFAIPFEVLLVFAILFEVLLKEIQEKTPSLCWLGRGRIKGHKIVNRNICEQTGVSQMIKSEKLQNENSPNYSNFRPQFSSELSPNFSRIFRALFPRKRRPQKIHPKSHAFFQCQNPQAHTKKMFTKSFWRADKVINETFVETLRGAPF